MVSPLNFDKIIAFRLFVIGMAMFILSPIFGQYKGKVIDQTGSPLAYVSIFDSTYHYSCISNDNGDFELKLPDGNHVVYFQLLGYENESRKVQGNVFFDNVVISLKQSTVLLPEVNVGINREDPAYAIMRKAIANRKINREMVNQYTSKVYGKALVKLTDAPEKVMGRPISNLGGILDSTRQGVIYLSESVSEISYKSPGKFKEKIIASKVSGDASGFSLNSFSRSNINFYDEYIDFDRSFIGPLNDLAFTFYNFTFIRSFFDESGHAVNQILVKPKSLYTPCFNGYIYITEDLYNIQSVDLSISNTALKSVFLENINIKQLYKPLKQKQWLIFSQNLTFGIGVFGFKATGYSNYLFLEQNLSPGLSDDDFSAETLHFAKDAAEKDSLFWEEMRPQPLTIEEVKDYIRKDSLEVYWKSPRFLDSIDRVNNTFKPTDLFFGYRGSNSTKEISYAILSPINNFHFNAVEGFNILLPMELVNDNSELGRRYSLTAYTKYGFSDHRYKYGIDYKYEYDQVNLSGIGLSFGNKLEHYNGIGGISNIANTYESLIRKNNLAKYYKKEFAEISWRSEVANGLLVRFTSSLQKRSALQNVTNYSFLRKESIYSPNNIQKSADYDFSDNIFIQSLNLRIRLGQTYTSYPKARVRIRSSWPDIFLTYQYAIPLTDKYANFSKIILRAEKLNISTSIYGYGNAIVEYGRFLTKNKISDPDIFHFQGNELSTAFVSNYLRGYRLLPYYDFSSSLSYLTLFYEHHFDGFLTDQIPFINRTGIKLVANAASLLRTDRNYYELGVGLEGFTIGPFDLFRFDYVWSFDQHGYLRGGIKIGLGEIFERDPSF